MRTQTFLLFLGLALPACQKPPPNVPTPPLPHSCTHPPDTLLVKGYFNLDSCFLSLNIQPDSDGIWCYLPEGQQASTPCPGWEGFIVLLDRASGLLAVESPLEPVFSSVLPIGVWADPPCSCPIAFDNSSTGRLPGNRFFAVVLLSERYLDCLLQEPGFRFEMKVLQSNN
ncbi:MAG: hypothetical protein KDD19_29570 [Phaeodactylibacter sp.]|nr:hypothetical protein [Phaeodactylibacter sp.]MCB9053341.1 hypothetical protein [Lewinellaceae bacterium]